MADPARLNEIIDPLAAKLGFELVRVKMTASEAGDGDRALQIMAEDPATGQLVIEQCAALSRAVSDRLDELEADGESGGAGRLSSRSEQPGHRSSADPAQGFHRVVGPRGEDRAGRKRSMATAICAANCSGSRATLSLSRITARDGWTCPLSTIHSAKLVLTDGADRRHRTAGYRRRG